jgi:hypothetical protein
MIIKMLICVGLIAALTSAPVFADEISDHQASRSDRSSDDIQRTESQTTATVGIGEQMQPILEPGMAAIEKSYGLQMQALNAEFNAAATEPQQDEVQQRMQALKVQWTLALANRQLELARQANDSKAEAEILSAIGAIMQPLRPAAQSEPRDPNAGIEIPGGAK